MVAVGPAAIPGVYGSAQIRGAHQRRQLQAGTAREDSHGDASTLFLFSA